MTKLKNTIKVIAVLLLTALSLWGLATLCQRKDSREKYEEFFSDAGDFDVLFFGNSHMVDGVNSMELWKDSGIASYNLGCHANLIPDTYWVMRNALEYTDPKLVVLDVFDLEYQEKSGHPSLHSGIDAFPLSGEKIRAVRDLYEGDKDKTQEYLYDFSLYHSRWPELGKEDFIPANNVCKGSELRIGVAKPVEWQLLPKGDYPIEETTGVQYLRKFIDYCQDRGIDVLLVKIPFPSSESNWGDLDQPYGNGAQKIADEYGVNYLNFFYDCPAELSFDTDLYDSYSHLNPSGAHKVTKYLGEYIKACYDIPDRRQDPDYASWNEDYKTYSHYKLKKLNEQADLYNYLMLLYDSDYYSEIQIDSATRVDRQDEGTAKLLENIKDFTDISYTEDLKYNDEKCDILIHVYNAKTHEELSTGAFNYAPVYDGNSERIS